MLVDNKIEEAKIRLDLQGRIAAMTFEVDRLKKDRRDLAKGYERTVRALEKQRSRLADIVKREAWSELNEDDDRVIEAPLPHNNDGLNRGVP